MSHLLVLLVLLMTTFLSGLFSPASAQFSMRGGLWHQCHVELEPVPPGGVLEVPIYTPTSLHIPFCIRRRRRMYAMAVSLSPSLPAGTQLISTNPAVASVEGPVIASYKVKEVPGLRLCNCVRTGDISCLICTSCYSWSSWDIDVLVQESTAPMRG